MGTKVSNTDPAGPEMKAIKKSRHWIWPIGVLATGVAGAAVVVLRGCWHSKMSWPLRSQGVSYQVCLACGIKRLFDETNFTSYGPRSYSLEELIEWDRTHPHRAPAA